MTFALRLKAFARHAALFFVSFAHGGLVVAGLLAVAFIFFQYQQGLPLLRAQQPAEVVTAADEPETAAPAGTPVAVKAPPDLRGVADFLARKYRVSSVAIEPLVAAAHESGIRMGLDPLLILAVMAIESRFNPFAESVMGAQGLMQVIPKFHLDKLEDGADESTLFDPIKNVEIGAIILKESIRRAGGSLQAGLQQYNGAPWDAESRYANKVMAEKRLLEQAKRKARQQIREA